MHRLVLAAAWLAAGLLVLAGPATAQSRVALVIANSAYQGAAPLKTTAADAGLVATTLKAAGYDVTEADDVTNANIGAVIGAFRDKIAAGGPDTVAFLYYAGYGAQLNADDYLVPVDVQINKADELPNEALKLSDVMAALGAVPAAARIIVLDAARDGGFGAAGGQPVPPGLALVGVPPGFLLAYSAAPGAYMCSCSDANGANSPFASALATLMRQPGLTIEQILDGVRLQVNQASGGAQTPWMVSALNVGVKLFDAPAAPQTLASACGVVGLPVPPLVRPRLTRVGLSQMSAEEAYRTVIEADSLQDYQWFVQSFPHYQLTGQIWDIVNRRRELILWRRTLRVGTTQAYWNYLDRYPQGIYVTEARIWLDEHAEPPPPPDYAPEPLDLPPGYFDEAIGIDYLVPDGDPPPPPVFGDQPPIYVPPPIPWTPPTRLIVVPPLPPPPVISESRSFSLLTVRQTDVQVEQPVPPIVYPTERQRQSQEEIRAIQTWRQAIIQGNQEFSRKYHVPAVAPVNALSPPSSPGASVLPATPTPAMGKPIRLLRRSGPPNPISRLRNRRRSQRLRRPLSRRPTFQTHWRPRRQNRPPPGSRLRRRNKRRSRPALRRRPRLTKLRL